MMMEKEKEKEREDLEIQKTKVFIFGIGKNGKLGVGDSHDRALPLQLKLPLHRKDRERAIGAACNHHMSGFLTNKGRLFVCGSAQELATETSSPQLWPVELKFLRFSPLPQQLPVKQLSLGLHFCIVLLHDLYGVYSWGSNNQLQLG